MTTQKAIAFAYRARSTATCLEIAYRSSKRLSEEWYALLMSNDIPFDESPLEDGNEVRPLTDMDIYGIINRCDELIADYEAANKTKLNTVIKASDIPADWR